MRLISKVHLTEMRKTLFGISAISTSFLLILPLVSHFLFSKNTETTISEGKNTISAANESNAYRIKKIVVDAGHGGHDTGCHGSEGVEKKNTLAMALKLGKKIRDNFPAVEVIYTRDRDEFIELNRRADIANKAKADLFISIHCNSTDEGNTATGTETYVLGLHRKEENFYVARRENASILLERDHQKVYDGFDPNSTESYIIFSLYQNAYLDKSILFAQKVENQFKSIGRRSLGVKQAGFLVLRETAMPSVLVETGFLNNAREGAYISSNAGQEQITDALLQAFADYKNAIETKETVAVASAKTEVKTSNIEYRIQLISSAKDLRKTTKFEGINNVDIVRENNIVKHFATGYKTQDEANIALKKLKTKFPDAFIVKFQNGKRIMP